MGFGGGGKNGFNRLEDEMEVEVDFNGNGGDAGGHTSATAKVVDDSFTIGEDANDANDLSLFKRDGAVQL